MKSLIASGIAALVVATAGADVVTQWNFNGTSATTVPGGAASPTASTGVGTASFVGGVTGSFASGTSNGGSSDPVTTTPNNYGWGITTFAAQGAENNGRGVQFNVSTVGFDSVVVSYDLRHSNTSSRYENFQYSIDGGTSWVSFATFDGNAGDTWFNNRTIDLSSVAGVANNANFAFRVVATFGPAGGGYVASNGTSTYATTGTWRFDMVTVSGNLVPAPGALALLAAAGVLGSRRRR
jgi:hypothetical protein